MNTFYVVVTVKYDKHTRWQAKQVYHVYLGRTHVYTYKQPMALHKKVRELEDVLRFKRVPNPLTGVDEYAMEFGL